MAFGLARHASAAWSPEEAQGAKRSAERLAPSVAPSPTSWLAWTLASPVRVRLSPRDELGLLRAFAQPSVERTPEWRAFWAGRYGPARSLHASALAWSPTRCAPSELVTHEAWIGERLTFEPAEPGSLGAASVLVDPPEPDRVSIALDSSCPAGALPRPVTLVRYGAEYDVFRLVECDGSVAPEAMDRLSVIARPPGAPRPELPLPLEARPEDLADEWVPRVKLVHPRLVWALQQLASAFPGRAIYLISGYRRDDHGSFHKLGRALDLFIYGTSNEAVLEVCRRLDDVGCGYYPNNTFVHVDVRAPGTGHALWIDASRVSEPARYVDAWPGVIEGGALAWAGSE
ncbi:MAG: DUF882 domain-containing protein [Polyangiaceae bacterium]|nr:DUF882 domain-containing protein [Polyangiaceae bacterium]